ncbi:MAG: hypothetical protein ACI89L_001780 [Phycisphaerales bacterium]|jgi:hypothetical protein
MLFAILAASAALTLASAPALAQATEFILDEQAADAGGDPWSVASAPAPGTDAATLGEARRLIAEGHPKRAKSILNDWIETHERAGNPHLAEAYLLRGDAWLAADHEYQALYDYETVVRDFPASPEFITAVAREYEIGSLYLGGLKRRWLGFRLESGSELGEELLIRSQERLPGSELAEQAAITLADWYYTRRELQLAQEMYAIFLSNYPRSEFRRHASLRQIFCAVARFKGPSYDASTLIDARLLILDYRARYPGEAEAAGITEGLLNRIDESAAQQMLQTARWYLRRGNQASAKFSMERLLIQHPASVAASDAAKTMIELGWIDQPQTEPPQPEPGKEVPGD